jgi:hypothetical protein
MSGVVRETGAMIAGMAPMQVPGTWAFVIVPETRAARLMPDALAMFREGEGLSLVLPHALALAEGFSPVEMACITLRVHSALDGVGLTAAVAEALAGAGIPCNMVAAYHHDHVFVPAEKVGEAMDALLARAARG